MDDDLHYGVSPVNIGVFAGRNRPSDELNETRAYGWKLWTAFLAVNALQALGWLGWMAR